MNNQFAYACAVCGSALDHETPGYLVTAHARSNRLAILRGDSRLANLDNVRAACGHDHALEIVAHWMVSGRLDITFTNASPGGEGANMERCEQKGGTADGARRLAHPKPIGELFINRESVRSLLASDPDALASVLDTLLDALLRNQSQPPLKKPAVAIGAATRTIVA